MQKLTITIAISLLALSSQRFCNAAQFTGVVAFGDSLSDSGQYGARFTVNRLDGTARTAIEGVAAYYGYVLFPTLRPGSTNPANRPNYAQGGQRVNEPSPLTPSGAPQRPISTQVTEFLRGGALDPDALYSVWGGANDIFVNLGAVAAGQITSAQAQANVTLTAHQLVDQLIRLRERGARYIMVFNLPDIGRTPAFVSQGPVAASGATQITGLFNTILNDRLNNLGFDVIPINAFALLNEVIADPSRYGFSNITVPACTTASAVECSSNTLRAPNADETFVFADGVHPTNAAHRLLAQYVVSVIEAPEKIALLAEAPLVASAAQTRALELRQWTAGQKGQAGTDLFAAVGFDRAEIDRSSRTPGSDGEVATLTVGGEVALSRQMAAGVAFGYSRNRSDLGGDTGSFTLSETMLSTYLTFNTGRVYGTAQLTLGDLDFTDVKRNIVLGPTTRTERGQTHGWHGQLRLSSGLHFSAGNITHGPVAALTYQELRVKGFAEEGALSTTMRYGDQDRDSLITSLGWQISSRFELGGATVQPFARATWEYEHKNDPREVRAGLVTMGGSFAMPVYQAEDNFVRMDLGVGVRFSNRVTGLLSYHTRVERRDGRHNAATLALRVTL